MVMHRVSKQHFILRFGLYLCVLLYAFPASSQQDQGHRAALIWHDFNDQNYQVMISEFDQQIWSSPQIVAQSDKPITTPALAILEDQTLLAVWSQQAFGAVRLMSANRPENSDTWSTAQVLRSDGAWNMNPNLIKDGSGDLWLFWSSSADGDTDIYVMKKSVGGAWGNVQRVHANNDVPDSKPQARLNETGNIQLEWFHLNEQARRYETVQLEIEASSSEKAEVQELQTKQEITQIKLPNFLPQNTSGVLLFKDNVFYQSKRID